MEELVINKLSTLQLFDQTISEEFICQICLDIVKNPISCSNCEHIFCQDCISNWQKKSQQCPFQCSQELQLKPVHRIVLSLLNDLTFKCTNINQGCQDKIKYSDWDNHFQKCQYQKVKCQNKGCEVIIMRKNYQTHNDNNCKYGVIICKQCNLEYPKTDNKHNCIQFLKQKLLEQKDQKEYLANFIKKQGYEVSLDNKVSDNFKQKCKKGHDLQWCDVSFDQQTNSFEKKFCVQCENYVQSRYFCQECNQNYCNICKQPKFASKKCPNNHQLIFRTLGPNGVCDICLVNRANQTSLCCKQCDFDVCYECYYKFFR